MLEDRLKALAEYEIDFKYQRDWFIIGLVFNPQWMIIEPSNPAIEYTEKDGRYYYGAPVESVKAEEIFDCINETIEYNKDIEKKMKLFNTKVEELQEMFTNENYDDLVTLEFKIKRKKTPKGNKATVSKTDKNNKLDTEKKKEDVKIQEKENDTKSVEANVPTAEPIPFDDGIVFVDTVAEAYREEEEMKKNKKVV